MVYHEARYLLSSHHRQDAVRVTAVAESWIENDAGLRELWELR
jgi:hypothetical protein